MKSDGYKSKHSGYEKGFVDDYMRLKTAVEAFAVRAFADGIKNFNGFIYDIFQYEIFKGTVA